MADDDVLLEAGTAAELVGVSASGLRRLAPIYEQVHGELPRKPKSHNRLWPQTALERLQAARRLVELERYRTVLEALEALQRGLEPDKVELEPKAGHIGPDDTLKALEVLTAEVRQLRQEVAALKALPAPTAESTPVEKRPEGQTHGLMVRVALWMERIIYRRQ